MLSSLIIGALVASTLATIAPTFPVASSSCTGDKVCKLKWINDDTAPSAKTFGQTSIGLAIGSTYQQTILQELGTVANPAKNSSLNAKIDASIGANYDGYFIKFVSQTEKDASGQPLTAFSARFELKGMTGKFSAAESAQIAAASGASLSSSNSIMTSAPLSSQASLAQSTSSSVTLSQATSSASRSTISSIILAVSTLIACFLA